VDAQLLCPKNLSQDAGNQGGAPLGNDYTYREMEVSNMMQSMMFSRDDDEEQSIYMSAIDMAQIPTTREPEKVPFLSCNMVTIMFRGLDASNVNVNVDRVRVSTHPLVNFPVDLITPSSAQVTSNRQDQQSPQGSGAQQFELDIQVAQMECFHCPMTSTGDLAMADSLRILCERVSVAVTNNDFNFQVQDIALKKESETVLALDKDRTNGGFVVQMGGEGTEKRLSIKLDAPLKINFTLDTVSDILSIYEDLVPVLASIGSRRGGSQDNAGTSPSTTLDTKGISMIVRSANCIIEAQIPPVNVVSGSVTELDSVHIQLNEHVVKIDKIQLELDNPNPVDVYSSQRSNATAMSKLQVTANRVSANVSQRNLDMILKDLILWNPHHHTTDNVQLVTKKAAKVTIMDNADELVLAHVNIVNAQITFQSNLLGELAIDLGSTIINAFEYAKLQLSVFHLHVSKDFSAIDGSGHFPLVHVASPHIKVRIPWELISCAYSFTVTDFRDNRWHL
jgi:hypothetical protein